MTIAELAAYQDGNMGIHLGGRSYSSFGFGNRISTKGKSARVSVSGKGRDTVSISGAGMKQVASKAAGGRHTNTSVDKTIDLKGYFDRARTENEQALEKAGASIDRNAIPYKDLLKTLKGALDEKYAKVSSRASSYGDTEEYLNDKYFNRNSSIYEADLSDAERAAGYRNEKSYLKTGHVQGVNFSDSLFRGIEFNGDVFDNDRVQWDRRVINKQIGNIMENADISPDEIPEATEFSIDPYTHRISVLGVNEDLKERMESALNVGDNGKNLFLHIHNAATRDGANSSQVTEDNYMKYQAFARVKEFTGLKLNELSAKGSSFYTDEGEDVLDLVNQGIEKHTPADYRSQMKAWIRELVGKVAGRGWNNLPDMVLGIGYNKNGLYDIKQDILFDGHTRMNDAWYSVL